MKKVVSFEYMRIVAMCGIVMSHCCYGWANMENIGRYLGLTFNYVFFGLSALLFGLKWEYANFPKYNVFKFLTPRFIRLATSYYPFLFFVFLFFYIIHEPFTIKNVALNFAFLSWFNKLPGFGHFWFLTMLIFCYILFVILSNFCKSCKFFKFIIFGGLLAVLLQFLVYRNSFPDYFPIVLFFCGALFLFSSQFLAIINSLSIKLVIILYTLINGAAIIVFISGVYSYSHILSTWIAVICGLTQLMLGFKLFHKISTSKISDYIAAISFEIYLVHHPFCYGEFSVYHITDSYILGFVLIIILSITLASILHKISEILYKKAKPIIEKIG